MTCHPRRNWRTLWRIQPRVIPQGAYQWADAIRRYRNERDLTQQELADRLGIAEVTVKKWEGGNYMPPPYLLLALSALE